MPKMIFVERDGTRREVDAPVGLSVLEIAHKHGIDLEGACEGSLACSTCHIVVDPEWTELLKEPTEDEEDMLDLAFGLTQTSRLGCQIIMSEELDGLTVSLPAGVRNMMSRCAADRSTGGKPGAIFHRSWTGIFPRARGSSSRCRAASTARSPRRSRSSAATTSSA
jgi:2Fe-2S ferredoxin